MENVRKLIVTLETVTPLFLGGAEPRGTSELRPPAFRGALRYWLRAALGGVIGNDAENVRRLESKVFGSTDEKAGGASTVTVRLSPRTLPPPQLYRRHPPVSVEKEGRTRRQSTGRDYLYWSMSESGSLERNNYQSAKQFYAPGASFDLTLNSRPGANEINQGFSQAVAALWLLVHFGGIGSRSRRTGGSLSVRGHLEAEGLLFSLSIETVDQAASQLAIGLKAIRSLFSKVGNTIPQIPSAFDLLYPTACRMWILGMWRSSDAAVESIGAAMRDFRTYREPDHANVARWLTRQTIPTVERAAFGLPLSYRYSDGGLSGTIQGRVNPPVIDRRASPLWLKVSKTSSGGYISVATLFKAAFLPLGEKLNAKTRGTPPPIPPPEDYGLIENFITESFPQCREVPYV